MRTIQTLVLLFSIHIFSLSAFGATHEIKMLNSGKDGMMVFEPGFLVAAKGDTVKFIPKDASHDVASVTVPKGAKSWSGKVDKAVTTTLDKEGVYFYKCNSHVTMAMVGIIQVGKPTNLAEVKEAAKALAPQFVINKDRLDKYLAAVK